MRIASARLLSGIRSRVRFVVAEGDARSDTRYGTAPDGASVNCSRSSLPAEINYATLSERRMLKRRMVVDGF
jgi:hypothetical protein